MGRRFIAGMGLLGLASASWIGTSGADPTKGDHVTLHCDNGQTYAVAVAPGNGDFTPAFTSTGNLIPVAFGAFTGVVRNTSGVIVDTFTEPAVTKGQSANGVKDPVTCTYTFTEVSDGSDPHFPLNFTFTGSGSVVVRIVPGR